MIRAVSTEIIIPPSGTLIPYRRPCPARVVAVPEGFFREAGWGRDDGEKAYFYDRQGRGYELKSKGLFADAYY